MIKTHRRERWRATTHINDKIHHDHRDTQATNPLLVCCVKLVVVHRILHSFVIIHTNEFTQINYTKAKK